MRLGANEEATVLLTVNAKFLFIKWWDIVGQVVIKGLGNKSNYRDIIFLKNITMNSFESRMN